LDQKFASKLPFQPPKTKLTFKITTLSDKKVVANKVGNPRLTRETLNRLSVVPQLKHLSAKEL
jgi:hypothetical protein